MLGQVGEAQGVGDMAAAFTDDASDVGMRIAMDVAQLGVARPFLERVEVGALHIFDDGDFERLPIVGLDDENRDFVLSGPLRRPPAPFAGDDFIGVVDPRDGADHHRLDHAALPDRVGEFIEFGVVKPPAGVARVRAQELDRRLSDPARRSEGGRVLPRRAEERGKASSQTRARFGSLSFVGHESLVSLALVERFQAARQRPSR